MSFFENTRKPVGLGGKLMVAMMNLGHSPVAWWGLQFLKLAPDAKVLFKDAAALLDYGFGKCNLYLDENRKNPDPVPIKGGVKAEVACRYTGEFRYLDTEGKNLSQIEKKIVYMKNLQAPVKKGDIVGEAQYLLDGKVVGKTDIVAAKSVKKAGLWDYIKHIRKRMIKGDAYSTDR